MYIRFYHCLNTHAYWLAHHLGAHFSSLKLFCTFCPKRHIVFFLHTFIIPYIFCRCAPAWWTSHLMPASIRASSTVSSRYCLHQNCTCPLMFYISVHLISVSPSAYFYSVYIKLHVSLQFVLDFSFPPPPAHYSYCTYGDWTCRSSRRMASLACTPASSPSGRASPPPPACSSWSSSSSSLSSACTAEATNKKKRIKKRERKNSSFFYCGVREV